MQISCENIELLQNIEFADEVYANPAHDLNAQTSLEKAHGTDMGRFATMQRKILPKANKKLPTWHKSQCFFTPKSYEQSTAEEVSLVKAKLIGSDQKILSLTGGLGVDDWALAMYGNKVVSLDTDSDLNCLVRSNLTKLKSKHISRIDSSAEQYLQSNSLDFDAFYLDPDRRNNKETKGLDAELFSPNIISLIEEYPTLKQNLWIKLSPATDLTWIRDNIDAEIDIYIIQYEQEVKEVLCHLHSQQHAKTEVISIDFEVRNINLKSKIPHTQSKVAILWEPCPALIKSEFLRNRFEMLNHLTPVNQNNTLFSSYVLFPSFIGKSWKIISKGSGGFKQVKKKLVELGINKASVTCKSYPLKPAEIMKKLKLKESSKHQLYFTTNGNQKLWFICKSLKV